MNLPNEYKTGNPGTDKLIARALAKELQTQRVNSLMQYVVSTEKQGRITVSDKAERTDTDGTLFASKSEMERYHELLLLQKAGQLTNLRKQVPFELCKGCNHEQYGVIRPVVYVADFTYYNLSYHKEHPGRMVVEDSKTGIRTDVYKVKRRLFLVKYPEFLFFEV